MNIKEFIDKVVNDESLLSLFCNLYFRWEDERMYEDINDYARAILNHIVVSTNENPTFICGTGEPFGVLVHFNKKLIHFTLKIENDYANICARV